MFALSSLLAPVVAIVPDAATAPALIVVGVMMMSSFANIKWRTLRMPFRRSLPLGSWPCVTVLRMELRPDLSNTRSSVTEGQGNSSNDVDLYGTVYP